MNTIYEGKTIKSKRNGNSYSFINVQCDCGTLSVIRFKDYKKYIKCVFCKQIENQKSSYCRIALYNRVLFVKDIAKKMSPILITIGLGLLTNFIWDAMVKLFK